MNQKKENGPLGKQSIYFHDAPHLLSWASIAGKKEGEGPLGEYFDQVIEDAAFGQDTWEEGESEFMKQACELALKKANYMPRRSAIYSVEICSVSSLLPHLGSKNLIFRFSDFTEPAPRSEKP